MNTSIPDCETFEFESAHLFQWTVKKRKIDTTVFPKKLGPWEHVAHAPETYKDAVQFLYHMVEGYHRASVSTPFDGIPGSKRGRLSKDATYYRTKTTDGVYWEYAVLPAGDFWPDNRYY